MNRYANPEVDGVHMHLENKKVGSFFFWFIWVMYALIYMTKYCFSSALAPIVESGILTKSQTGLIAASFHFIYAPLQILGGIFADRYNPEKMIKIGLGGSAIANLVIFLNQNYYVMLIAWMFNAATQFALWPSVFKIMASQLPRSEKKKNAFYMSFCTAFGLLISYVVAAILPAWQYNFALSCVISLGLLVAMHFICKKVDRYMLPDKDVMTEHIREKDTHGHTMKSLMLQSGLLLMIIIVFIRTTIGQGSKTMAPTMLMESYDNISASIGNILNIFIILSGIAGTLVVKYIIYPRFIKNEVMGFIVLFALTIPMTVILRMIGTVTPATVIASMCLIAFFMTAASLYASYYNLNFAAFGKDGAVAGISNCASSIAMIVQTYGFNVVADNFGWKTVSDLWIVMTVLATALAVIALPIFNKFKKDNREILSK